MTEKVVAAAPMQELPEGMTWQQIASKLSTEQVGRNYWHNLAYMTAQAVRTSETLRGYVGRELTEKDEYDIVGEYVRIRNEVSESPACRAWFHELLEVRKDSRAFSATGASLARERHLTKDRLEYHILLSSTPPAKTIIDAAEGKA